MPVLHVYPFALRQGDLSPRINEGEINETLKETARIVLKVSDASDQLVLKFQPVYTLDLPEGTLEGRIPAQSKQRKTLKDKLTSHPYLQKMKSFNVVRVFFVWDFAEVAELVDRKPKWLSPKGLTIDSYHLMVVGSKTTRALRGRALAHEFGHGLLGLPHSQTKGNLMYYEVEGARESLAGQQDTFSAHAATIAGGISIIDPP